MRLFKATWEARVLLPHSPESAMVPSVEQREVLATYEACTGWDEVETDAKERTQSKGFNQ